MTLAPGQREPSREQETVVPPPPARTPPRYPTGRLALIVIVAVVVATAVIVAALSSAPPQAGTGAGETIPTPAPASSIRGIVSARIGADRVLQESDAPDPAHPGNRAVQLAFHAADYPTHSAVIAGIKADVFTLMKALFTSGKPIGQATLVAELPYQNSAGDYSWCIVSAVSLTKERAEQVRWDRVGPSGLWADLRIDQAPRFCR